MNGLPLGAGAAIARTVISAIVLRLLWIWCVLSGYLCIDNAFLTQQWIRHVRFAASKPPDSVELCSSGLVALAAAWLLQEYCFHLKESQGPTEFIKHVKWVFCHSQQWGCWLSQRGNEVVFLMNASVRKFWEKNDECVLVQLSVWINSQNSSESLMESGELNRLHEDFCQMNILKKAFW